MKEDTPLILAIKTEMTDVVKLLLEDGAPVDVKDQVSLLLKKVGMVVYERRSVGLFIQGLAYFFIKRFNISIAIICLVVVK